MERSLKDCIEGDCGVIAKVIGNCQTTARLQELGFVPGGWFRVIRKGDPAIIQVGDSRFCLRKEQVQGIVVILSESPSVSWESMRIVEEQPAGAQ